MRTVVEILASFSRLQVELKEAIQREFPIGSWISYDHGRYTRDAKVVGYGYYRSIQVVGSTGVPYWLDIYRCLSREDQDRVMWNQ
jgi:hypothetical protein